jgi:hypothetical protein
MQLESEMVIRERIKKPKRLLKLLGVRGSQWEVGNDRQGMSRTARLQTQRQRHIKSGV